METVKERYRNDPIFHTVVNHMRLLLSDAHLSPSEVREAAMLACIIEEEYRTPARNIMNDKEFEIEEEK